MTMCGIFGFVGENKSDLSMYNLRRIALKADERGGHAVGVYAVKFYNNSKIVISNGFKHPSRMLDVIPSVMEVMRDAFQVLGHARLSTSGDWNVLENNQPIVIKGLTSELNPNMDTCLVHNGNIEDHKQIFSSLGLKPKTDNDSEALASLIHYLGIDHALNYLYQNNIKHALLARSQGHLYASRLGLPLYASTADEGTYFCSKNFLRSAPLEEKQAHRYG